MSLLKETSSSLLTFSKNSFQTDDIIFIFLMIVCVLLSIAVASIKKTNIYAKKNHKRKRNFEYIFWIVTLFSIYALIRFSIPRKGASVFLHEGHLDRGFVYAWQTVYFALSIFAFNLWMIFLKYYRVMANTPIANIRSAVQGYVELEGKGKVDPYNILCAPLTKRPCLWYKYSILERVKTWVRNSSWKTIEKGESTAMILLQDDTGECFLDIEKAEINFSRPTKIWSGATPHPDDDPPDDSGIFPKFEQHEYSYREEIIMPDDNLYALGMFHTVNGQFKKNNTIDSESQKIIKLWKTDYQALLNKYDIDKDGFLNEVEWNNVIKAAEEEVYLTYPELRPTIAKSSDTINILSDLGLSGGKPFLISDMSHVKAIEAYRFKAKFYPSIFVIFVIFSYHFEAIYGSFLTFAVEYL